MDSKTEQEIFRWIMKVPKEEDREQRFRDFLIEFKFAMYKETVKLLSNHLYDKFVKNVDELEPEVTAYSNIDGPYMIEELEAEWSWSRTGRK